MSDSDGAATPTKTVQIHLYGCTDVGHVREHNEDNFLIADLASGREPAEGVGLLSPRGAVFGVCDGMGGAAAGEIASQLAVDIILEKLVEGPVPTHRDDLARRLIDAVEQAGLRIFHNARNDRARRGMGTTSTIAVLMDDRLFLAQVGDSRAYIYRGGELTLVTRDQSLVNQLIEAGQLTEQEADSFEHNNIILQALGTAETVQVDLTYVDLKQGDMLLLCSDGLSGMIKANEMKQVLAAEPDPMQACRDLIHQANSAGGHDNITVILVRFDGDGLEPPRPSDPPLVYRKYQLAERDKRRDTARPGSLSPASSPVSSSGPPEPAPEPRPSRQPPPKPSKAPPPSDDTAPPARAPGPASLKVGMTLVGDRSVLGDLPAYRPPEDPTPQWTGGPSPRLVGSAVVSALLIIASLGYWLLR